MLNEMQSKNVLVCRKEKHVDASLHPSNSGSHVMGPLQYKLECWLAVEFSIWGTISTDVAATQGS